MTDTNTTQPEVLKKSKKKILAIIFAALILLLGANHFMFRIGYADVDVAVTDSTTVVTPMLDTTVKEISPAVSVDTASHQDTVKARK